MGNLTQHVQHGDSGEINNSSAQLNKLVQMKKNLGGVENSFFPMLRRKSDKKFLSGSVMVEDKITLEELNELREDVKRKEEAMKLEIEQLKKEYISYIADMEVHLITKDGLISQLQTKIQSLQDEIAKMQIIVQEQTKAYMEVLKDNSKLEKILKEHEEKFEKEFSKAIARSVHDLKNPLTGIKSATDVLLEYDDLGEEKRTLLSIIMKSATDIMNMIEDILVSNKITHGVYKPEKKRVSLKKMLNDLVEQNNIYAKLIGKEISFNYKCQDSQDASPKDIEGVAVMEDGSVEGTIEGDELKLKRAFGNLISNGLKYGKQHVEINVVESKEGIHLYIHDDGQGFDKEVKEKIFSNNANKEMVTTDTIHGNGFGLTNTKRIIEMHGGLINLIDSEKGTTFHIYFKKIN
jgi:signal transduction histidine kinase